jgi:hypothetical protein
MTVSVPDLKDNAGIYSFRWVAESIEAQVDRLREGSRYELSGELTIRTVSGHIHQARLNLTSTAARHTLAKFLDTKFEFEWDQLLEQVCVKVLERHRQGEPIQQIGKVVIPEKMADRLHPIIADKEANLIFGEGGIGKSYLAAYFAMLVAEGMPDHQLMPEPGPVLYLDYETSNVATAIRFDALHRGYDLDYPSTVQYRFCFQPLASEIQEIQQYVAEKNIQMLVIDSAGPACGGEPETAQAAIQYFTALRSLRITTLTIAHKSKNGTGPGPFGSVYWTNYPRNIYEVQKAQEPEGNSIDIALFHRKVNDGRLMKPLGLKLSFEGDMANRNLKAHIEPQDPSLVPDLAGSLSIADQIAGALKSGKRLVDELADELGAKQSSVSSALIRGKGTRFVKLSSGEWGLITK